MKKKSWAWAALLYFFEGEWKAAWPLKEKGYQKSLMVRHILKICGGQENIENWLRFSQKLRAKRALLKSPQDGVNDFKLQSNTNAPNF